MPRLLAPLALAIFALPAFAQPAPEAEPAESVRFFQPADVFELERAGDPRISPDGGRVVYTRLGYDVLTDRTTSDLWIINADGTGHQPLVTLDANASQLRWSPGGERLAFVSSKGGRSQVFVHWFDSGRTAPVTRLTESPSSLTWSPDGGAFAFTMFVPNDGAPTATVPKAPKDADWGPPIEAEDRITFRADGRGGLDPGHTHVFVVPSDGGTPRQLTSGDFDHNGPLTWSPDGLTIVVSANRYEDRDQQPLNSELWAIDVESAALTQLTDRFGPDEQPVYAPNGELIAYVGFDDEFQGFQRRRLYVMNADGTGEREVVTPDFSMSSPTFASVGSSRVYVSFDANGEGTIGIVDIRSGAERKIIAPLQPFIGGLGGMSIGRPYGGGSFTVSDNGVLAFNIQRPDRPADLAFTDDGHPRILTTLNEDVLGHRDLGRVEEIRYSSTLDGTPIHGWIVYPPDFDPQKKYPLILEIHGGPFANYGPRFAAEVQLMAANGYVVLYTNPRGSTSYGEDFANAIHHAYPGDDYQDLMDGVDAVIERGFIDEERLFVTGGSGGGVLTAWIVGTTDRFRAAVVQKPVINWYSFVLYADFPAYFYKYWFPGPPWEHEAHYMARSPISRVGNVTTPTMLITGTKDLRTPMPETEQYYTALKIREVPTKLVRVPDAYHGIASRPSNLIAKVAEILSWFEEHGAPEDETPDGDATE